MQVSRSVNAAGCWFDSYSRKYIVQSTMPPELGWKLGNGSVLIRVEYLNTRFPGSLCEVQREAEKKNAYKCKISMILGR